MKLKDVEKFIDLAKLKGVSKLSYEDDDCKIEVCYEKTDSGSYVTIPPSTTQVTQTAQSNQETPKEPEIQYKEIKSPFVGTFYQAPTPDSEAYVKVGQSVAAGDTLCIIEAMKIMNEIESEESGVIVEICVENETYVEFGQTLFKIK